MFKTRLISGIVLVAVAIVLMVTGNEVLLTAMLAISLIGMFELYRIFVEVAKEGNITKASEKLNVSQPAITKQIKNLEEQLSMKLLERKSKGVELTLEGKKLYEKIRNPIEELNTIDRQACKEKVINIGTHNHIGSCIFGNVLNKYYLKYPNVNLNLICEETYEMMRKLQNKELDIVFCYLLHLSRF